MANATYAAVPQQTAIVPIFTVEKLQGKVKRTVHLFDPKERKILSKVIEVDAGYLVKFPKGHSIRAYDEEHLKALGADLKYIPLVDENSGEQAPGFVINEAAA